MTETIDGTLLGILGVFARIAFWWWLSGVFSVALICAGEWFRGENLDVEDLIHAGLLSLFGPIGLLMYVTHRISVLMKTSAGRRVLIKGRTKNPDKTRG